MANLSTNEKQILEKLLQMKSGWVLNFTDRTMGEFFKDDLKIDIYNKKYSYASGSKANYMRGFWSVADDSLVGKSILKLVEYIKSQIIIGDLNGKDFSDDLMNKSVEIANKLPGRKNVQNIETVDSFLETEYKFSLDSLKIEIALVPVIQQRFNEIERGFKAKNPLSIVLLCGSTLEGVLLGFAIENAQRFNQAVSSPKHKQTGKVLQLQEWNLSSLIDVSHELKLLDLDVKKHSHSLRDFRNYIHPFEQMSTGFNPTEHTAKISFQVLKAVIAQLSENRHNTSK